MKKRYLLYCGILVLINSLAVSPVIPTIYNSLLQKGRFKDIKGWYWVEQKRTAIETLPWTFTDNSPLEINAWTTHDDNETMNELLGDTDDGKHHRDIQLPIGFKETAGDHNFPKNLWDDDVFGGPRRYAEGAAAAYVCSCRPLGKTQFLGKDFTKNVRAVHLELPSHWQNVLLLVKTGFIGQVW